MTGIAITSPTMSAISTRRPRWQAIAALVIVALILIVAYWPTLLRQPAGSDDPLLEDAGEFQVALNVWGTVHGTGYPLYTIAGNVFVHAAKLVGVDPALAPSLFSLLCGLIALAIGYLILLKLTGRITIAASSMLLFGLTRATWAYNVFPKTYSFSLIFYFLLFAIPIWPPRDGQYIDPRRRLWWLALVGGFAIAHHRLLAFIMPGLLIAILPDLWRWFRATSHKWQNTIGTLALCLPLAAIGFIPYIYLPLRALAHGVWVYGDPSTPIGFWREFTAVEANYLFTPPPNFAAWLGSARDTLAIIPAQVTPIGLIVILVLAIIGIRRRYEARIAILCAIPLLIFVLIWPHAVVAQAVIQPIVGFLIIAAAIGLAELIKSIQRNQLVVLRAIPTLGLIGAIGLYVWSFANLSAISGGMLGLQEIAVANRVAALNQQQFSGIPVFVVPWGMRYSAVAFSHYVLNENPNLEIGDHNTFDRLGLAPFGIEDGNINVAVTDKDSFGILTEQQRKKTSDVLAITSPAADVILFPNGPTRLYEFNSLPVVVDNIIVSESSLTCQNDAQGDRVTLHVKWLANQKPTKSYSVFVHLIGIDPNKVLATGDENAPVYGRYPTNQWLSDTLIEDTYPIDRQPGAVAVQFGLYEQPQPGKFINYPVAILKLADYPGCG